MLIVKTLEQESAKNVKTLEQESAKNVKKEKEKQDEINLLKKTYFEIKRGDKNGITIGTIYS